MELLSLLKLNEENLAFYNEELEDKSPIDIIKWVMDFAKKPIVTTNFRPYEAAILNAVTKINPQTEIVWCDTGYNTLNTYKHAAELIDRLNLNIHTFIPKQTKAFRDSQMGIPDIEDPKHEEFSFQVKIEPFTRAMKTHQPDVWFTNLREGQTEFRNGIGVLSFSKDGVLKVSPFYHWSDEDLDKYLMVYGLPNELKYFDPTKALNNRECGIHN